MVDETRKPGDVSALGKSQVVIPKNKNTSDKALKYAFKAEKVQTAEVVPNAARNAVRKQMGYPADDNKTQPQSGCGE